MSTNNTDLIKSAGIKITQPRKELLAVLSRAKKPMSVQKINEKLAKVDIDQATVYRNLQLFLEKGIVKQIDLQHGHAHYELKGDDHHHLICKSCGLIEDFRGCEADALMKKVLKKSKTFSLIDDHSIEFFGYCKKCS